MLDNTTSAIFLKDPDGRYLLVNRAFERSTERPAADLVGRLDREVMAPDVAERLRVDDLKVMAERTPIEVQEDVRHGDQTRTFLAVKFPLIDERGPASSTASAAWPPTSPTTRGWRRGCARPSASRRSASSPAASRTTSTTCSR